MYCDKQYWRGLPLRTLTSFIFLQMGYRQESSMDRKIIDRLAENERGNTDVAALYELVYKQQQEYTRQLDKQQQDFMNGLEEQRQDFMTRLATQRIELSNAHGESLNRINSSIMQLVKPKPCKP